MTHGSLYKFSNIKEKPLSTVMKCGRYKAMLSYPALKNLRDRLAASAETVLKSDDEKVVNLINKLEEKMTSLKEKYNHYCEIENKMINYYYNDLQKYFVKSSGKFSINKIENDLKAYDKAYKDCEKFRSICFDCFMEAAGCYLLDPDNNDITNDKEAHKKYTDWYEKICDFQKEIHDEIQYQINENETEFYDTVELIKTKLDEEDEEEFKMKLYEENEEELSQFEEEIKEK